LTYENGCDTFAAASEEPDDAGPKVWFTRISFALSSEKTLH
jgi:hypothetical protein